jgi:hypothetical protein
LLCESLSVSFPFLGVLEAAEPPVGIRTGAKKYNRGRHAGEDASASRVRIAKEELGEPRLQAPLGAACEWRGDMIGWLVREKRKT